MNLTLKKRILFGTYTYFERPIWFLIQMLPKVVRRIFYRSIFASFGKNVFIDEGCYFRYPWKISISDDVIINRGCEFYPSFKNADARISLGQGVVLGPRVIFFGAGQDPSYKAKNDISDSIEIEDGSYIGGNSTIRYGVRVGKNAVIGAGSVVVSEVKRNTIFAGNPAKFIKSISG